MRRVYILSWSFLPHSDGLLGDLAVKFPIRFHSHGPVKFVTKRLRKDLFNRNFVSLAPGYRNTGVHVVDLGCSQRYFLVVVLVLEVHFGLGNFTIPSRNLLDDLLFGRNLVP